MRNSNVHAYLFLTCILAYFRHFLNFCLDISFFDDMFFRVCSCLFVVKKRAVFRQFSWGVDEEFAIFADIVLLARPEALFGAGSDCSFSGVSRDDLPGH